MPPRDPSRPHIDTLDEESEDNGNGSGPTRRQNVGTPLDVCKLGDDCPYASSMRWLSDERLKREQVEGELAGTVDRLGDEIQKVSLLVQATKGQIHELDDLVKRKLSELDATISLKVIELDAVLKAHVRSHRWLELLVMGLAMGAASAITRWLGSK